MENNTPKSSSGLAIAGLVLGIIAAVTSFLPIINNISFFIALIGLVLAAIALVGAIRGKHTAKGLSIAGVVLCVVSIVIVLASQSLYKSALDSAAQKLKNGSEPVASSSTTSENKPESSKAETSDAKSTDAKEDDVQTLGEPDQSTSSTEQTNKTDSANAEETNKPDYSNMSVGETVTLDNGLSITLNSVEAGPQKYDGTPLTKANITYVNNGTENASFNIFDWKSEDANGVETSFSYYSQDKEQLESGKLKAGGTVTGNVYFEGDPVRIVYYSNVFQSDSSIGWAIS